MWFLSPNSLCNCNKCIIQIYSSMAAPIWLITVMFLLPHPRLTFLSQSSGAWISAASFNRANIYACTFINQYTWQSRVRDISSVQRCLCVHVLESRPSLVALCLRGGSVYTMQGIWACLCQGHAHKELSLPLGLCVHEKENKKERARERKWASITWDARIFSGCFHCAHTLQQ